jgi:hypothetical protein
MPNTPGPGIRLVRSRIPVHDDTDHWPYREDEDEPEDPPENSEFNPWQGNAHGRSWSESAAFRMSKHDLRARPIYHHKRDGDPLHDDLRQALAAIHTPVWPKCHIQASLRVDTLNTANPCG